jgi:8-oxo-dGTP pyrophosphatase MutT (NUDIX family)
MKKLIHVANVALIDQNNKILLLKRSRNLKQPEYWGLVGGLVDAGETPESAAIREVTEETGMDISPIELSDAYKFLIEKEDENIEICLFKSVVKVPIEITLDAYEHSEYRWFDLDEISNITQLLGGIPSMLNKILVDQSLTVNMTSEKANL